MALSITAWNWDREDWPKFTWDRARFDRAEQVFLLESGFLTGLFKHLNLSDHERITVEAISTEAVTTSEIEGEVLDRASVQSSVRRELGLNADARRSGPKEQGMAEMMVDVHRNFGETLTEEMLCGWHRMLFQERMQLREAGCYRTGNEPMQVVSGPAHLRKVHFEAPPAGRVRREMARFVKWFNAGREKTPPLTRAGTAHLFFESIRPFEDGNGRIGRATAEKALAQALGRPTLAALASTIPLRRKAYYSALERATRTNEITEWLAWFAGIMIEAQRRATARVEFLIDRARLLDRLRGKTKPRAGEGRSCGCSGQGRRDSGGLERGQVCDDHRSVNGDGDARSGGTGGEGAATANGGAAARPVLCGSPIASGGGSAGGSGRAGEMKPTPAEWNRIRVY